MHAEDRGVVDLWGWDLGWAPRPNDHKTALRSNMVSWGPGGTSHRYHDVYGETGWKVNSATA